MNSPCGHFLSPLQAHTTGHSHVNIPKLHSISSSCDAFHRLWGLVMFWWRQPCYWGCRPRYEQVWSALLTCSLALAGGGRCSSYNLHQPATPPPPRIGASRFWSTAALCCVVTIQDLAWCHSWVPLHAMLNPKGCAPRSTPNHHWMWGVTLPLPQCGPPSTQTTLGAVATAWPPDIACSPDAHFSALERCLSPGVAHGPAAGHCLRAC